MDKTRFAKLPMAVSRAASLIDQAAFSAGNFVLTLVLAKNFSNGAVIGYGVGISVALMLQTIFWTTYVIQCSIMPERLFRWRARTILGEHAIVLIGVLALEILVAAIYFAYSPSQTGLYVICSVVMCTLIYLQLDFERIFCLKHGRQNVLFVTSGIFLGLNAAMLLAVPRYHLSYGFVIGVVLAFSLGKILHLGHLSGGLDWMRGARLLRIDLRRNFSSSLVGATGGFGYFHLPVFLVSRFAAPAEAAAFIALRGLMQPMMIVIRSLDVIDKNHFSKLNPGRADLRSIFLRQIPIYAAGSVLTIVLVRALGPWLLHLLYGDKYDAHAYLLIGWAIVFALIMLLPPIDTVVAKLKRNPQYNYIRMAVGIVGAASALVLCVRFQATGAIAVAAGGYFLMIVGGLWLCRDAFFGQRRRTDSSGRP